MRNLLPERPGDAGARVRGLLRRSRAATLATLLTEDGTEDVAGVAGDGRPYASLVTVAWDMDARPILLLSQLADHTRALDADARASLLIEEASGLANPQAGPRVTLVGRIRRSTDETHIERHARRFLARHPAAQVYAGFGDFHFHVMEVERAHFIGGFGEAYWLDGGDVILKAPQWTGVAACETEVIAHMNSDHADAVSLYATRLLGRRGTAWMMVGVDPDGADLRLRNGFARLPFAAPVGDAASCREALVGLVGAARAKGQRKP